MVRDPDRLAKMVALYNEGKTQKQIAIIFHISKDRVRQLLHGTEGYTPRDTKTYIGVQAAAKQLGLSQARLQVFLRERGFPLHGNQLVLLRDRLLNLQQMLASEQRPCHICGTPIWRWRKTCGGKCSRLWVEMNNVRRNNHKYRTTYMTPQRRRVKDALAKIPPGTEYVSFTEGAALARRSNTQFYWLVVVGAVAFRETPHRAPNSKRKQRVYSKRHCTYLGKFLAPNKR
jgi:predicted nucleic acid-binding Zn ribbon protein